MRISYVSFLVDMSWAYEKEQERLGRLLQELLAEEKDEQPDNVEDENIENCIETREDWNSEQEGESATDEKYETQESLCFIRRDGTKWNKHPFSQQVRTAKANIVLHLPGVKGVAKNAKTPLDCWKLFFWWRNAH